MTGATDGDETRGETAASPDSPRTPADLAGTVLIPLVLVLLTALGSATYALLRQGYLRFYRSFATTPEDVGVSHLQMLAGLVRSWPTVLGVAAFSCSVLAAVIFLWVDTARRLRWARVLLGVAVLLASFAAGRLSCTPDRLRDAIGKVYRGQTVVPSDIPFISVQVFPAELLWKGDKDDEPRRLVGSDCLMYLGHADGKAVLYDRKRDVTWVVSEDDVVIELHAPPRTACPS